MKLFGRENQLLLAHLFVFYLFNYWIQAKTHQLISGTTERITVEIGIQLPLRL